MRSEHRKFIQRKVVYVSKVYNIYNTAYQFWPELKKKTPDEALKGISNRCIIAFWAV